MACATPLPKPLTEAEIKKGRDTIDHITPEESKTCDKLGSFKIPTTREYLFPPEGLAIREYPKSNAIVLDSTKMLVTIVLGEDEYHLYSAYYCKVSPIPVSTFKVQP